MLTDCGRLPDFFIVGAAKSATTWLFSHLHYYPEIFMPTWKEPLFFSHYKTPFNHHLVAQNLYQYTQLFWPAQDNQILGEASVSYLYRYARTIENIKEAYGADSKKIKIIISLRNPVDRAFSNYCLSYLCGVENLPFEDAIKPGAPDRLKRRIGHEMYDVLADFDYLEMGWYYEQVAAYMREFPQTHIILYDDIVRDPQSIMRGLCNFLSIPHHPASCATRINSSGLPRIDFINIFLNALKKVWYRPIRARDLVRTLINLFIEPEAFLCRMEWRAGQFLNRIRNRNTRRAAMKPETRRMLLDLYRPDILKLQTLIGRDLSPWLL